MRSLSILALAVAVATAAETDRNVARAQAYLKRGIAAFDAARAAKTTGQRLEALKRTDFYLRRADGLATKTTDLGLQSRIRATLLEATLRTAGTYYERKSLPRAKEAAKRALTLDPGNARGSALLVAIERAEREDIFAAVDGVVAIDRIRARRLAAGTPLRDRGVARRR